MHTGTDLSTDFGHLSTFPRFRRLPAPALPLPAILRLGRRRGAVMRVSTACVDNSPILWTNAPA